MQIAEDIYAYVHPLGANCVVFAFKDGSDIDLLDTGLRVRPILQYLLKQMGRDGVDPRRVRRIFHTHVHFDHVQADRYFQQHAVLHHGQVEVWFPDADAFRFAPNYNTIAANASHVLQYFPPDALHRYRGVSLQARLVFGLLKYKTPKNLHPFNEGDELMLGRYPAKVWCPGGHTEGHAIMWLPDAPALVVGDNDAINETTSTFGGILESHRICREIYAQHSTRDLLLLRGHNAVLKGEKGREWNDRWFREFAAISSKLIPHFRRQLDNGKGTVDVGRIIRLVTGYLARIPVVEYFAFMRVFVILKFLQEKGFGKMRYAGRNLWFDIATDARDLQLEI